jgi:putative NADH-flavin reductase
MKLAIFGGTGRTGQYLVQAALEQGYQVTVLARNPSKLSPAPNLTVVPGDVKDPLCVQQAISGADAVLSVLGPTSNQPTFEISQGTVNLLAAMRQANVRRLILTAGAGVPDPHDSPAPFNHLMNGLLKLAAKNVLADMRKVVEMVRSSDRDWTVVRLPMLTGAPKTGCVRVGYVGKGLGPRITRADLANFLLDQVQDTTYLHKSPAISN